MGIKHVQYYIQISVSAPLHSGYLIDRKARVAEKTQRCQKSGSTQERQTSQLLVKKGERICGNISLQTASVPLQLCKQSTGQYKSQHGLKAVSQGV